MPVGWGWVASRVENFHLRGTRAKTLRTARLAASPRDSASSLDERKINALRCNATRSAAAQCHTGARVLKARKVLRSHSIVNRACSGSEEKRNHCWSENRRLHAQQGSIP